MKEQLTDALRSMNLTFRDYSISVGDMDKLGCIEVLHGKPYCVVAGKFRILNGWCAKHAGEGYFYTAEIVEKKSEKDFVEITTKIELLNGEGKLLGSATGTAREIREGNINLKYANENCETSSYGRTLSFLGVGLELGVLESADRMKAVFSENSKPEASDKQKQFAREIYDGTRCKITAEGREMIEEALAEAGDDPGEDGDIFANLSKPSAEKIFNLLKAGKLGQNVYKRAA
ncbi:MAG TPA: hypothetical protein P5539_10770 [Mesotoga sp.]|nr:hypothetical protein [Mesotoga sp.]